MSNNSYKDKIIKSTAWNLIGTIMMVLIGIGSSVLFIRYLGSKNYGVAIYITDISIFCVTLCSLGLGTYQSRILQQLYSNGRYAEFKYVIIHNMITRISLVVILAVVLLLAGIFFKDNVSIVKTEYLGFLCSFLIMQMVMAIFRGPLLVEYQQKFLNTLDIATLILRILIVLVVIMFNCGLRGFLLSEVIVELVQIAMLSSRFKKLLWNKIKNVQRVEFNNIFSIALPMYLVDLSNKIYGKEYDIFLIGMVMGSNSFKEITVYSLSYVLVSRVYSFLGIGTSGSAGLIMNFASELIVNEKKDLLNKFIEKQLKLLFLVIMPLMFGGVIAGGRLLHILYGSEFERYSIINSAFFVGYSVACCSFVAKPVLFVLGMEQKLLRIRFVVTVIKSAIIIPVIMTYGIVGAALTSTILMIVSTVCELKLLRSCINFRLSLNYVLKISFACIVMGMFTKYYLYFTNVTHILTYLIGILMSVVIYCVVIVVVKPLDKDDCNMLQNYKFIKKCKIDRIIGVLSS